MIFELLNGVHSAFLYFQTIENPPVLQEISLKIHANVAIVNLKNLLIVRKTSS